MFKKYIFYKLIIILLVFPALAEQVITDGSYIYTGNISENEACSLAKDKAKLKALEKVSGQRISTEEIEMCSEVDGKTSCERNQFFLSSFDSEITKLKELKKDILIQKIENSDEQSYICKIKIQTEVIKKSQTLDNSFDFNVKLNEKNFKEGDEFKIDLILKKPIYLSIFQILPYEKKDYQVYKIFPNSLDSKNFLTEKSVSLPKKAKYQIFFPSKLNKRSVDEYLLLIGSEKNINWLEKYAKIEDLKSAYIKEKSIIYKYKGYTIYK